MAYRKGFAPGEWYHCYSRGIDKRSTFEEKRDYDRFLELLYLCNSSESVHRSNLNTDDVFETERVAPLTSIGAFCLMPNHFHLLLKQIDEGGISEFMQKLGTAYTMYFNIKYQRSGGLFVKPFRSRHIPDDHYFQRVIQYIHCNPAELYEPGWKDGKVKDNKSLQRKLLSYRYSSFEAFADKNTARGILDPVIFKIETQLPPKRMLEEAQMYYAENSKATP
jgi:putative transposase